MRALDLAQLQGTSKDDGLRGLLGGLMGLPCDFRKQSNRMDLGPSDNYGARAWVDMLSSSSVGDELVNVDVDASVPDLPAGGVQEVGYGIRERAIQVTAISLNQELHKSARAYLELLENKLALTETGDAFAAFGLAIIGNSTISTLDPAQFGRATSAAAMDIQVRYGTRVAATTVPRIATAHVTGTVDERDALDLTAEL